MEPAFVNYVSSDAQGQPSKAGAGRLVFGSLLAFGVIGVWLVFEIAPGELIRPVNPDLFAVAVFLGVLSGLLLAARVMTVRGSSADRRPGRRMDAMGGVFILPLLISTACLRVSVQAVAFIGVRPQSTQMEFTIDGFRVSHGSHAFRVRLGEVGREFSVRVPSAFYNLAQQGDSITLPVETGRFGIQRAMVTAHLTNADLHHNS